eukprot:18937-Prymnesium_polylepis.1
MEAESTVGGWALMDAPAVEARRPAKGAAVAGSRCCKPSIIFSKGREHRKSRVAVQKTHEWRSAGPRPAAPRAMPA